MNDAHRQTRDKRQETRYAPGIVRRAALGKAVDERRQHRLRLALGLALGRRRLVAGWCVGVVLNVTI